MNGNPLLALKAAGQQVWLDQLSRRLLQSGQLQRLIDADGVVGVTSNPAIFARAISEGSEYAADLERLRASGLAPEAIYEALVIPDIQAACDALLPTHVASAGAAGLVSLEVSPLLAHDTAGTLAAARRLALAVDRANLLIKVPGTPAGVDAFEELTATGGKVNVTLIFSLAQYEAVAQAYLRGARRWAAKGGKAGQLRSVASVFLSRVDSLVDRRLAALSTPGAGSLLGKSGIALARCCYQRYRTLFETPEFAVLAAAGVPPQLPLWASTGSKNPAYGDVYYVEALIGPHTVTTLPEATLAAFRARGKVAPPLAGDADAARQQIDALLGQGIDLDEVGETLQTEGIRLFVEAYEKILLAVS